MNRSDSERSTRGSWKRIAGLGAAASLAAVVGIGALGGIASAENLQRNVALDGATSARIDVSLQAGELILHGDAPATDLVSGSFDYEASSGEPEFRYAVVDGVGELEIEPEGDGFNFTWPWDMVDDNRWDLAINSAVPTDLEVDVDAGKLDLALGGTNVRSLDVDADAAQAEIDLSGVWTENLTANLEADAGQLSLTIPTGVGVRLEADVDAGDKDIEGMTEIADNIYVNDAYETAPVTLTIKADVDAGQLKVRVAE